MLQSLVARGFLAKSNYGRWTTYRLAMEIPPHAMRNEANSPHLAGNLPHSVTEQLLEIAAVAREKKSLSSEKIQEIIRNLCRIYPLTVVQIAELLQRTPKGIRDRYISKMIEKGEIQSLFSEPNHPQQAYKTHPDR